MITALTLGPEGRMTTPWHLQFVEKNQLTHVVLRDTEPLLRKLGAFPCPMDLLISPDMEVVEMGQLPITEAWIENQLDRYMR